MSAITVIRLGILGILAAVLTGCGSDTCGPGDPCRGATFEVRILTSGDEPVEGAWVEGGIDWTQYKVRTDASGVAVVPKSGQGRFAEIHKDNFYPVTVSTLQPGDYHLYMTPYRLELIGDVAGKSIRFDYNTLLTLEYSGTYHAYAYDESTVTELADVELEAAAILDVKLVGDTLWLSTDGSGVYAYSLEDPLYPIQLLHLNIDGYTREIAVMDSIIAVAYFAGGDSVDVFSYTVTGETKLTSSFRAPNVRQMEFRGHHLIALSYHNDGYADHAGLKIVDLADPHSPDLVYSVRDTGGRYGLITDDYVMIGPNSTEQTDWISYTTIRIDDPESPVYAGRIHSDIWVYSIDDRFSLAVGQYCKHNPGGNINTAPYGVAQGGPAGGFYTVAILSERDVLQKPGVQRSPFFVIGDALWRLEVNEEWDVDSGS